MIHARKDYNRFQDPALNDPSLLSSGSTPIAEDEPVFLLRAQDRHFIAMLAAYTAITSNDPDGGRMRTLLRNHAILAEEWQQLHGCKSPDLPREEP